MTKKKLSKKQELTLDTIATINLDPNKVKKLKDFNPESIFLDHTFVGEALLQCLIDNDTEAFMEILDSYLRVNKKRVAKNANLTRSTVQSAFSKNGNPTLKTIAKIVHHETAAKRS